MFTVTIITCRLKFLLPSRSFSRPGYLSATMLPVILFFGLRKSCRLVEGEGSVAVLSVFAVHRKMGALIWMTPFFIDFYVRETVIVYMEWPP